MDSGSSDEVIAVVVPLIFINDEGRRLLQHYVVANTAEAFRDFMIHIEFMRLLICLPNGTNSSLFKWMSSFGRDGTPYSYIFKAHGCELH